MSKFIFSVVFCIKYAMKMYECVILKKNDGQNSLKKNEKMRKLNTNQKKKEKNDAKKITNQND